MGVFTSKIEQNKINYMALSDSKNNQYDSNNNDVIIKYIKDNNNTRMHELANFIINHENFRYKKDGNWNNTNPEFQEYFMVLLKLN